MPYDKSKPYSCPCCGYWNGDMKYDYYKHKKVFKDEKVCKAIRAWWETIPDAVTDKRILYKNDHEFAVGIYTIYCGAIYPETLEVGKMYTIDELCGEGEE